MSKWWNSNKSHFPAIVFHSCSAMGSGKQWSVDTVRQVKALMSIKNAISNWRNNLFIEMAMAKKWYPTQRKNRFKISISVKQKIVFETYGFQHFPKTRNIQFFCSNGLDMTQFDKERQFFLFFPRILNKTVFFLRQPDRLDFLLLTFQNVKNSPVFGDIIRPKNGLQTHTFNSKRKYPIHRNNLYSSKMISFGLQSCWVHPKFSWSRIVVSSSRSTFSSSSSTWEPYSASFQATWYHSRIPIRKVLVFDEQTGIPNSKWVSVQISFKRNHWIFNIWRRFRSFMSWETYPYIRTLWLWNPEHLVASSIFTWVHAGTASAVCPSQSGSIAAMASISFATVIWDADEPFSVKTAKVPESSLTKSPRSTTRPLYFWCFASNSAFFQMTDVH